MKKIQQLPNKSFYIEVSLFNDSPTNDTRNVSLKRDESVVDEKEISLDAFSSTKISLEDTQDFTVGDKINYRVITQNREPEIVVEVVEELSSSLTDDVINSDNAITVRFIRDENIVIDSESRISLSSELKFRNNSLYANKEIFSTVPENEVKYLQFQTGGKVKINNQEKIEIKK